MITYTAQFETNEELEFFLQEKKRAEILRNLEEFLRGEVKYNDNLNEIQREMMITIRERIFNMCLDKAIKLHYEF